MPSSRCTASTECQHRCRDHCRHVLVARPSRRQDAEHLTPRPDAEVHHQHGRQHGDDRGSAIPARARPGGHGDAQDDRRPREQAGRGEAPEHRPQAVLHPVDHESRIRRSTVRDRIGPPRRPPPHERQCLGHDCNHSGQPAPAQHEQQADAEAEERSEARRRHADQRDQHPEPVTTIQRAVVVDEQHLPEERQQRKVVDDLHGEHEVLPPAAEHEQQDRHQRRDPRRHAEPSHPQVGQHNGTDVRGPQHEQIRNVRACPDDAVECTEDEDRPRHPMAVLRFEQHRVEPRRFVQPLASQDEGPVVACEPLVACDHHEHEYADRPGEPHRPARGRVGLDSRHPRRGFGPRVGVSVHGSPAATTA